MRNWLRFQLSALNDPLSTVEALSVKPETSLQFAFFIAARS